MDNFARRLPDAPSLTEMLSSAQGKMLMYGMWDRPSLLDSESRYSLSGSTFPRTKSNNSSSNVWRQGVSLPHNRETMQNHMPRAHGASNTELPSAAFSRNHSREGYPNPREDPRDGLSGYLKDLDSDNMQSASRMPEPKNYIRLGSLQASGNSSVHKESRYNPGITNASSQLRDGQGREMNARPVCSNPGSNYEDLLSMVQILNGRGDDTLSTSDIQSQASSSKTIESRKSLLEDLKLLQLLKSVHIPKSSQATKASLPEADVHSFWGRITKQLHEDQLNNKIGIDESRSSSKISQREKNKESIEVYPQSHGIDQLPSWSDVALRKEKSCVLSSVTRRAGSKTRIRSPQRLRHSSPGGSRELGSRSPSRSIRPLSRSPGRYRTRSPVRYKSVSRSPNRYKSRSPILTLSGGRSLGNYGSGSPGRYRSRSPGRYKSVSRSPNRYKSRSPILTLSGGRSLGNYGSGSPGRYRSRSPGRYRNRSPGRYRSRSPEGYRSMSPGMYSRRSPGKHRSRSPGMYSRGSHGMYRSQSPGNHRSRSPGRDRSRSPGKYESHGSGRHRSRSPIGYRSRSPGVYRSKSPLSYRSKSSSHRDVEVVPMNPLDVTSPYKLIGALCLIEAAITQASTPYVLQVMHSDIIEDVFTMPHALKSAMFHEGFELSLEAVPSAHPVDWKDPLYQLLDFAYESKLDIDVYVEARAHDDEMDIRGAKAFELAEYFRGSNVVITIVPLEVWESRVSESGKKKKKKKKKGNAAVPETVLIESQNEASPGAHSRFGPKTLSSRPREPFSLEDKWNKWKNVQSRFGEQVKEEKMKGSQGRIGVQERLGAWKSVLSRLGDRVDTEVPVIELDSD